MSEINLRPLVNCIEQLSSNVSVVAHNVEVVSGQVSSVAKLEADTRQRLEELYQEFASFVAADARQKALQLASTRLVEIRQMLEKRFGHYAEVRRTATGILQATDVALVRKETMQSATENLMLNTPGYWLAPTLVALNGWISNDRGLADKALKEAIRRSDAKSSLFFALICRRAGRLEASVHWLKRYFQNQNPSSIDHEVVVMLDAVANGVFGPSLAPCSSIVDGWLRELEEKSGFAEEQRKRWAEALGALTPTIEADAYPTLRRFSPTWPELEAALARARRNQVVYRYFEQIFSGEIVVSPELEAAADGLLESLVTNFDDEELPLRREERRAQLIIEEEGDTDAASRRLDADSEFFEEQTNFAAVLTGAAMFPERSGATRATQRYAVSLSHQWILSGCQDLVVQDRSRAPNEATFHCGTWEGGSRDGCDEQSLAAALSEHYEERATREAAAVKLSAGPWLALLAAIPIGLALLSSAPVIGLSLIGGAAAYFYFSYRGIIDARETVRQKIRKEKSDALDILRACLAEWTDFRREFSAEDAKAEHVAELIGSLSSPEFVLQGPGSKRTVIAS